MTDTITLPRAVIERTLKCLNTPANQDLRLVSSALYAALAQQAEPAIKFRHGCQWCGKQNCTTHQQVAQQSTN